MAELPPLELPEEGKLTHNITHFARALRKAGLPVGPGKVIDAVRAVAAAGFTERADFYWTLQAVFVSRPEQRQVFAQVFRLYWRDPRYLEHMMSMMLPSIRGVAEERQAQAAEKRAAEALLDGVQRDLPELEQDEEGAEIEIDASRTASARERLRSLDFEQMSTAEIAAAKRMLASLSLPVKPLPLRRSRADSLGRMPDWRATMRGALRQGGEIRTLATRNRRERWPSLVVLCDISGSMSQYSRMVLHFVHSVANHQGAGWAKVHAFTFGTRLTNITRHLAARDVDSALAAAGALSVADTARLLRIRGQAMQEAVPVGHGAMAALLGLDFDAVKKIAKRAAHDTHKVCEAANDNDPGQVVISGDADAVKHAVALAQEEGAKRAVMLPVSAPFHCSLMKPAARAMAEALDDVAIEAPKVPVVANVLAHDAGDPEIIRSLLVDQVTHSVRWRESVAWMVKKGVTEFWEIGAGKALSGMIRRIERSAATRQVGTPDDVKAAVDSLAE